MLKPLLKIGIVVGILAMLGLYVWWSVRIPAPSEANRVTHREGVYSIIKPPDWEVHFNYAPGERAYLDTLEVRIPSTRARDLRIFVGRYRDEPNLDLIRARDRQIDTQFQSQPAHVFTGRTRREHYWRAVFERGGQWYELVFWMPYEDDVPTSGWFPYLESFRASPAPAAATTTAPASL